MNPTLLRRVEAFRSRAAVRAWECRQRGLAKGAWFRFRRVLAAAEAAYAVSAEEAATLITEGIVPEPAGAEFNPPKVLLFVPESRAERLTSRRQVPLHLAPDLLLASALVLVPFPERMDGLGPCLPRRK